MTDTATSAMPGSGFIVKRDSSKIIRFTSLQSTVGRQMLEVHKIDTNYVDSLVLFEEERYFVSSTAALKVLAYFEWMGTIFSISGPCASPLS